MGFGSLAWATAPVLYNTTEPLLKGATPSLPMDLYNHIASLQALNAAMHSASQIKFAILFCLKFFQQIAPLFRVRMYSNMFLLLLYPTKDWSHTL